ncbi:hypothetical protein [Novosphingobium sp.]|uniref:hypothetical protein n=1 Tax=Novosphingobium sp. TaxID=1874826 RepID=UPI00286DB20D|nr:hypothetical protein [Novosphingobium sp.]
MMETIQANWLVLGVVALAVLLVAWWLLARGSKPAKREYKPDVLDEGAAPARRNQALIDAAPAAAIPQVIPSPAGGVLGGVAEVVAVAAQDQVEEVQAATQPEIEPASPVSPPITEPTPEVEPAPAPAPEITPAPEPDYEPVAPPPPAAPPPMAAAAPAGDDLARIKGLGPKLQALLPTLGITTFAQIAAMTEADLAVLDSKLGPFAGRPAKDNWVEQAKYLAAGDVSAFESQFGRLSA